MISIVKTKNLLAAYIKNAIISWYFPVSIVLYVIILFLSTYNDYAASSEHVGAEYFLHYAYFNSSTRCFTIIICAVAASTIFCKEWLTGYYIYTCTRAGKMEYSISVLTATAFIAFLVSVIGASIYLGIICIKYPLISSDPSIVEGIIHGYTNGGLIGEGKLFIYYMLTVFLQGAFSALFTSAAVIMSLFISNPYLTIVSPMVIYTVTTNIMSNLELPRIINPYYVFNVSKYINEAFGDTGDNAFSLISCIYPYIYSIILIILFCLIMKLVLKNKYEKRET